MPEATPRSAAWDRTRVMLVAGALILALSFGVRHSFGLFLQPISLANGWGRETFAFAMALQNLVWGISQPFAGMLADRHGARPVIIGGTLLYLAGLLLMAVPQPAELFVLSTGLLIGLGLSGTTFPIVFGAISRTVPAEDRSHAFGIAMAVCSLGQFAMLPLALALMEGMGWSLAILVLSGIAALILPLSVLMRDAPATPSAPAAPTLSPWAALRQAAGTRDFVLLATGFFVCGFHVTFVATHLPAFLADSGLGVTVATMVLALIGLFNIAGTYYAGLWGGRMSKSMLLVWIYLARAVVIAAFVLLPVTPASAYAFAVAMGLLWLSTVPLTNGIVAGIFGVANLSMLAGVVFLSHQVGAFLGGWLGGLVFDRTGSYDTVWWLAVLLSLLAAALNLPIRETPLAERAQSQVAA